MRVGDQSFTILRHWDAGFALDKEDAPHIRGLVDLYDGARHLSQCLIVASSEDADEMVYEFLVRMYEGFERQRAALDPAQIVDIRYEDLVADPVQVLDDIYRKLDLGALACVRSTLESFVRDQPPDQTNTHQLTPDVTAEVLRRWRQYAERYGYARSNTPCATG